jgi:hypothetical protein
MGYEEQPPYVSYLFNVAQLLLQVALGVERVRLFLALLLERRLDHALVLATLLMVANALCSGGARQHSLSLSL